MVDSSKPAAGSSKPSQPADSDAGSKPAPPSHTDPPAPEAEPGPQPSPKPSPKRKRQGDLPGDSDPRTRHQEPSADEDYVG